VYDLVTSTAQELTEFREQLRYVDANAQGLGSPMVSRLPMQRRARNATADGWRWSGRARYPPNSF
jgi:hypothetical protein